MGMGMGGRRWGVRRFTRMSCEMIGFHCGRFMHWRYLGWKTAYIVSYHSIERGSAGPAHARFNYYSTSQSIVSFTPRIPHFTSIIPPPPTPTFTPAPSPNKTPHKIQQNRTPPPSPQPHGTPPHHRHHRHHHRSRYHRSQSHTPPPSSSLIR